RVLTRQVHGKLVVVREDWEALFRKSRYALASQRDDVLFRRPARLHVNGPDLDKFFAVASKLAARLQIHQVVVDDIEASPAASFDVCHARYPATSCRSTNRRSM